MAKPKGRPKRLDRDDVTVRMARRLVGMAKAIATHRGVTVAEVLDELAGPAIDRAYVAMLREGQK